MRRFEQLVEPRIRGWRGGLFRLGLFSLPAGQLGKLRLERLKVKLVLIELLAVLFALVLDLLVARQSLGNRSYGFIVALALDLDALGSQELAQRSARRILFR